MSVRNSNPQLYLFYAGKVRQIIAGIGYSGIIKIQFFQKCIKNIKFLIAALKHMPDAQVTGSYFYNFRLSARYQSYLNAGLHQHFQTQSVHGVEGLYLFTTIGKVQFAIAEYAVNIKHQ